MPLTWTTQELAPPGGDIAAALRATVTTANTVKTALSGVKGVLSALSVTGATVAVNSVLNTVFGTIANAIADIVSGPGISMLIVTPQRVDYGRARLREQLTAARTAYGTAEKELDALETQPDVRILLGAAERKSRAAQIVRARDTLNAANREIALLDRADRLAGSDLRVSFPWSEFQATVERSFTDLGDYSRPQFSSSSAVAGVVYVVGSDSLTDFAGVLSSLASWANSKPLGRQAASIQRLLDGTSQRQRTGTPHESPDWQAITLARALGIEKEIDALRASTASMGLSTLTGSSATAGRVAQYLANVIAALEESVAVSEDLLSAVQAIPGLLPKAQTLYIPPVDGERVVATNTGGSYRAPNITAGVDGFVSALQEAAGAPRAQWCAGIVFLVGVPLGIDATALTQAAVNDPAVQALIGQAQAAFRVLKAGA